MWRRFGLQNGGVHIAGQQNQVRGDSQLSKELRDLAALDRRGSALGVLNTFSLLGSDMSGSDTKVEL
jgi:hypothetical protein